MSPASSSSSSSSSSGGRLGWWWLASTLATILVTPELTAQSTNPLNLFVVDVSIRDGLPVIGTPRKLTRDNGTNSQPSFSPDGRTVVFSGLRSAGPDARSDIFVVDLASGVERQVTSTPENENSPTITSSGEFVAVRWVPATLFREFGLWVYGPDGTPRRGVLPGPDTTGYYLPLDGGALALMRPKSRFTVAVYTPATGRIEDIEGPVAALPPQRIPGTGAISYTMTDSSGRNLIRRTDLATRSSSTVAPAVRGRTVHSWLPGGTLLMGKGNTIYALRPGLDTAWRNVRAFTEPELSNVAAYTVSAAGDKLVLTSTLRPPLNVALRDSLEAGHSAAAVARMFGALRGAGRLDDWFRTPGILGLADERHLVRAGDDEVAFVEFVATLYPASHTVQGRLGDAWIAAGNRANASSAFRRALQLNPRASAADSAAATRVERALRELGPPGA
ncbi:MAG: hypothetical protein ACT4OZ_12115 [Gemmatimonadota bacterium]